MVPTTVRDQASKSLDIREKEEEALSIEQVIRWLTSMDWVGEGAGLKEMAIATTSYACIL